jgi:hypothetical protein
VVAFVDLQSDEPLSTTMTLVRRPTGMNTMLFLSHDQAVYLALCHRPLQYGLCIQDDYEMPLHRARSISNSFNADVDDMEKACPPWCLHCIVSKELKLLSNSCCLKRPIYLVPVWKQEYSLTVVDETEDGEATPWTTFMNNVVKQL